jgi:Cut12 conserved domain
MKPQGILLTPGTGTTRRKTVSFGASVVDNEGRNAITKSGIPKNCPGKFPSPWTPKVDDNLQPTRRTALTKTLEAVRDSKGKRPRSNSGDVAVAELPLNINIQTDITSESRGETTNFNNVQSRDKAIERDNGNAMEGFDGDMTIDLNEPHSQSGRFWKSEYERYHEDAKAQMMRLVKYKQLAKSYAKTKDSEAIDLREKLNEEQQRVADMEERISELLAQITDKPISGSDEESPELMNALTRQTALAVQCKDQVEKFRVALQGGDAPMNQRGDVQDPICASQSTAQTLIDTSIELKRAREQLREMGSLRAEMHNLRLNLSAAEKRASRLRDENHKLSQDLARANDELKTSEKIRESAENESQKQDERLQSLQKEFANLKKLAKLQRQDAENLLRRRHDQVANLKRELSSMKKEIQKTESEQTKRSRPIEVSGSDGDKFSTSPSKVMSEDLGDPVTLEGQANTIDRGSSNSGLRRRAAAASLLRGCMEDPRSETYRDSDSKADLPRRDDAHLTESRIPVLDKSVAGSRKAQTDVLRKASGAFDTRRPTNSALAEIINNEDVGNLERDKGPASRFTENFHELFSDLSMNTPSSALPLVEPPLSRSPPKARRYVASPRPSMFNMPASPPKQPFNRVTSSGRNIAENRFSNAPSSRLSSFGNTSTRAPLPADRAAAAKARLEKKRAEKRKAQLQLLDDQKENARS